MNTRTLGKLALSAAVAAMILASLGGAAAASDTNPLVADTPYPDKDKVVKVEPLKPAAGSASVPLLELVHYSDQSVAMHFQAAGDGQTKAPGIEVSYDISINAQAKEYQATKTERELDGASSPSADGSASRSIKIQAYDPVRALLSETLATYAWSWTNGIITPRAGHDCGPQNPTAAGTRWFETDCWRNEYMAPTRGEGSVQATGKYSNSDWMFPTQWTYNHQWVYLSGRAGGAWVIDAWQRPTGEDSWLLSAKISYR